MLNYFKYFLKYRILTGILTIKFYKLNNNEWNINNNIKANSDFSVQKFSTNIVIGEKTYNTDCIANQNENNMIYFYFVKIYSKEYLISVYADKQVFATDNKNALNNSFIKDVFDHYLFFNE